MPASPAIAAEATDPPLAPPVARRGLPWKRIAASFALVVGVFGVYSVTAVPLMEPAPLARPDLADDPDGLRAAERVVERQRQALVPWFAPGDWELTSPKVIESPRGKLLFRDYKIQDDGRVKFEPCTVILLNDGASLSAEERNRRAVVLQAPQGALLTFDSPVDPKQAKFGHLVGATLLGQITIRSDQRAAGPDDDLLISTHDVELVGDTIVTPNAVDFRLGPNSGRGRQLLIQLAPGSGARPNSPAPNFSGVKSFALVHDVHMRLHPGRADLFPGPGGAAKAADPAAGAPPLQPPVEIKCDGEFRFDVNRYVATFAKRVDVLRMNPMGPPDQLTCELLSLFFEPAARAAEEPAAQRRGGLPKLEPSRVEADGNPVVIRSPSRGFQTRGHRLEYDLRKNTGSFGGPGWFQGSAPDGAAARPIEATWQKQLAMRPYEGNFLLTIEGAASVASPEFGNLKAEQIFLYLVEQPPAPGARPGQRPRLLPDRLQAYKRVVIRSPQLTAMVNQLQVWFEYPPDGKGPPARAAGPRMPAGPIAAAPAADATGPVPAPADAAPAVRTRHFQVDGDLLQVEARVGRRADASRIHIEGRVRLTETASTSDPAARPLAVRGDQVDVIQPTPQQTLVRVAGRPAHVEARELAIDGGTINVDRARNLAWVDGHGRMTMLVSADLSGQPIDRPRPLEMTWEGRMDFDGRRATFRQGVVAVVENQRLTTEMLEAQLDRAVSFADDAPQERPQVDRIQCRDGVYLERRVVELGRVTSQERMRTADLTIYPQTGALEAAGPGWVRTVRVDNGRQLPTLPGLRPAAPPAVDAGATGQRLAYVGVNFDGGLRGNQRQQLLRFERRIRCAYGPVADWDTLLDPDEPEKLPATAAALSSDRLQVALLRAAPGADATFELAAEGNTRVEADTYSARAARLTYDQAKDQLILMGDGRGDAYLSRQQRVGGPRSDASAGRILFYPSKNRVDFEDGRQLGGEFLGTAGRGTPAR